VSLGNSPPAPSPSPVVHEKLSKVPLLLHVSFVASGSTYYATIFVAVGGGHREAPFAPITSSLDLPMEWIVDPLLGTVITAAAAFTLTHGDSTGIIVLDVEQRTSR